MKALKISDNLELPVDVIVQATAVVGVRGSGKTTTAKDVAEELLELDQQIVIIDPLDVWRGLKSSKDGKRAGYPIALLGGEHGDVPIYPDSGKAVADFVVDKRASVILSLRHFDSKADERRFVTDFCVQVEMLIVHRITNPHDRKAIQSWLEYQGTDDEARKILGSLQELKRGEAWVWSPSWLGVMKRVTMRESRTFDSSATPKLGERVATMQKVAPIDLEELTASLAAEVERAKDEDPQELRKRIKLLERDLELAKKQGGPASDEKVGAALKHAQEVNAILVERLGDVVAIARKFDPIIGELATIDTNLPVLSTPPAVLTRFRERDDVSRCTEIRRRQQSGSGRVTAAMVSRDAGGNGNIAKGDRAVLTAVAQHGDDGCTREQITVLTGYKRSTRDLYLQRLQRAGMITPRGNAFVATLAGVRELGDDFKPLPTGLALREHWLANLPEGERAVLQVTLEAYPKVASRDQVSEATGYKRSTRDLYIQKLARRKLVTADRAGVRASENLF